MRGLARLLARILAGLLGRLLARLLVGVPDLTFSSGVCDHGRDLSWVRLIHDVAGAFDLNGVTLGPRVVPTLEIGIDDLIAPGDDSPARLCPPRCCGQRRAENLGRGQN